MTSILVPVMSSSNLLKRTFDHADAHNDTGSPDMVLEKIGLPIGHTEILHSTNLQPQPLASVTETNCLTVHLSNTAFSAAGSPAPQLASPTEVEKPTSKRRKLTLDEQEARRLDKEEKDRQRAEEKAKKEVEREDKRKIKEAQIKSREDERRKKEEEKNKKEKSQLRLNAYFVKPVTSSHELVEHPKAETSPSSSRPSSRSPNREETARSRSPSTTPQTKSSSDYERTFPPFFLQSHTVISPQTRFVRDQAGLEYAQTKIDEGLAPASGGQEKQPIDFDLLALLHIPLNKHPNHFIQYKSVKELVAEIRGTSRSPVDLTRIGAKSTRKSPDLLAAIPIKYLQFAEDVRPPYIGTFTKILKPKACLNLCRNPFSQTLPAVNYDYDSEAEWEEPGEGEDLESEGEEEEEDDDADDIEEFLDDAEETGEPNSKRRLMCGDLEPISTGLCWGNQGSQNQSNNGYKGGLDLKDFKIQTLSDQIKMPIDPYSKAYWQSKEIRQLEIISSGRPLQKSMEPPRHPLHTIVRPNDSNKSTSTNPSPLDGPNIPIAGAAIPRGSKPLKRIASELLEAFKEAVTGSDLTKAALVDILKKQFPTQPKDAIKDTLGLMFERAGPTLAEKRWAIKPAYRIPTGGTC